MLNYKPPSRDPVESSVRLKVNPVGTSVRLSHPVENSAKPQQVKSHPV